MQVFNVAGDAVNVSLFCNKIHNPETATEMVAMTERKPKNLGNAVPKDILEKGAVFTCPVCRSEIILVPE